MTRLPFLGRASRATARALAVTLVCGLASTRAHAQPACVAGTLADYIAPGFACRLGDFAFDEFRAFLFTDASEGMFTFVSPADISDVLPFTRADADGTVAIGFDFLGLGAAAGATFSERGDERAVAVAQVQFLGRALTPDVRLVGARADLTAGVQGAVPGTTFSEAMGFAYVDDLRSDGSCLHADLPSPAIGVRLEGFSGTCDSALTQDFFVLTGGIAVIDRDGDDRPASLFSYTTASSERVTFITAQVVPEPSTAALAATGLLGLAGATARGRARARPAAAKTEEMP